VSEVPNLHATDEARAAVIRQLAGAYDEFAEQEKMLVDDGYYAEAEVAHEYAMWVARAFRAESDDPPENLHPHVLAIPGCPRCDARGVPHG